MAIALVQHPYAEQASGSTSQSLTITSTTAGNLIVVAIGTSPDATTITSVVDNASSTYVQATGAYSSQGTGSPKTVTDIWYSENCNAGATSVTVTFSATSTSVSHVGVLEYSGAATSGALDTAGQALNGPPGTTATGPTLVTTVNGDVLVSTINTGSGTYTSVASPFTTESAASVSDGVADYIGPAAGSYAVVFTVSSGKTSLSSAAFKPAGSSGGNTTRQLLVHAGQ